MTPELKAAVDRARRAYDNLWSAYDVVDDRSDESLCTLHAMIQADLRALAAEHPADDDEPVDLDWLEEQLHDSDFTVSQIGWKFFVQFEGRVQIKTRGQLRALLKELGV